MILDTCTGLHVQAPITHTHVRRQRTVTLDQLCEWPTFTELGQRHQYPSPSNQSPSNDTAKSNRPLLTIYSKGFRAENGNSLLAARFSDTAEFWLQGTEKTSQGNRVDRKSSSASTWTCQGKENGSVRAEFSRPVGIIQADEAQTFRSLFWNQSLYGIR